ncbi:MAG: hypothetical protein V1708_03355 [Candidatus Micrarchaeota archaeon]
MLFLPLLSLTFFEYSLSSDQIALLAFFVSLISAIATILHWHTAKKTLDFEKQKFIQRTKVQFARFPNDSQLGILFKKEPGETFTIKNDGNTDFRVSQVSFSQTNVKDQIGYPLHIMISEVDEKKIIKPEQTMDVQIPVEKLPKGQNLCVEVNVLSSEDEYTNIKIFKKDFVIPYARY